MGELQTDLDHANAWDLDSRLDQAMDALRCPPPEVVVDHLSGGERRRVALCKLLLQQPDLLLLDEPTNHLDAESVQWLEGHLASYPGAVLAVTHDRYFLDNVASWILELDRGKTHPYEGNYSTYLETKKERLKVEGAKDAKRAKMLERELEWVRSNPKARQAKSKSRLARYEEMAAEAERNRKIDVSEINIPAGPRLGDVVLEAEDLTKGFDDRVLIHDLDFKLPRAGIVGVIGPNGVGKTTLFRMIVGEEKPDAGELKVGQTVQISYVDQSRGGIDPNKNVWEVVSDGLDFIKVANFEMPSRAYIASFGFKGPDQQKKAGVLSGGERNRLNLALTLKMGGNMLLLDEPTNDLDVETLQSLEDALLEFPGCAVITSHDRWFLDRTATHILAWEGDDEDGGQVVLVRGQLRVLRGEQDRAARRRGGAPAPGHAPAPHPRLRSIEPSPVIEPSRSARRAVDARPRDRPRLQPGRRDRSATAFAGAVAPVPEPLDRRVDLGEVQPGLLDERADLRPLERDGGTLRVMLVVGVRVQRSLDDPGIVTGEAGKTHAGACPLLVERGGRLPGHDAGAAASRPSAMIRRWISDVPSKILVSRASRQYLSTAYSVV